MRYVLAAYSPLNSRSKVPFGVVLHDGSKTFYYFDASEERKQLIKQVNKLFDEDTFTNFSKTFEEMFIKPGKTYTTDEYGVRREIDVNSEEFLEYLAENYDGPYLYRKPLDVEGSDPRETLHFLTSQLINTH